MDLGNWILFVMFLFPANLEVGFGGGGRKTLGISKQDEYRRSYRYNTRC